MSSGTHPGPGNPSTSSSSQPLPNASVFVHPVAATSSSQPPATINNPSETTQQNPTTTSPHQNKSQKKRPRFRIRQHKTIPVHTLGICCGFVLMLLVIVAVLGLIVAELNRSTVGVIIAAVSIGVLCPASICLCCSVFVLVLLGYRIEDLEEKHISIRDVNSRGAAVGLQQQHQQLSSSLQGGPQTISVDSRHREQSLSGDHSPEDVQQQVTLNAPSSQWQQSDAVSQSAATTTTTASVEGE